MFRLLKKDPMMEMFVQLLKEGVVYMRLMRRKLELEIKEMERAKVRND